MLTIHLEITLHYKLQHKLDTESEFGKNQTSCQDGGVGRYTVPLHTTKRRTTTNLKTKNNQNCHKIKLYGSLTTKELKKKHSSRLVGRAEMGSWGREDSQQGGSWRIGWKRWWLVVPHLHGENWEEQLGSKTDHATQGSSQGSSLKNYD